MARFVAITLSVYALILIAPSYQQYYYNPYDPMNVQGRLFFGGQLLPGFLVRTTTTTTTSTVKATCTQKKDACAAGAEPFPNGFGRSLEEILADGEIAPSETVSVKVTALPEAEVSPRQADYVPSYYPYGPHGIDSSIIQSAGYYYYPGVGYPVAPYPGAAQARLFVTRTVTSTTITTSTRTLNPECSKAGFFTECK